MEFRPPNYPPFPHDVPCIELQTFSVSSLEKGDPITEEKLFEACKAQGFFFLDLKNSQHEASSMPQDAEELARVMEEISKLPVEEKEKFSVGPPFFVTGWKKPNLFPTSGNNSLDTGELFNIAKDFALDHRPSIPVPQLVLENKALASRFARNAHALGMRVISILNDKLGLPSGLMEQYHRIDQMSADSIRLLRGQERQSLDGQEIQVPGHTDYGTVTILFNWLGGLQMWSDEVGDWLWVRPPAHGQAIINLGDCASRLTGGVLKSGKHRVVPAPGQQALYPRYSVVYFVRPEDAAVVQRLEAPGIPCSGNAVDDGMGLTMQEVVERETKRIFGPKKLEQL